jgi:iron-sulfur cluster assembly protein
MSCCKPQQTQKIHPQMTIEEILALFPNKAQKLSQEITNAGLHCVGCHAATWETLEGGMLGHGKTQNEIEHLTSRLNALLEEEVDCTTVTMTARAAEKYQAILKDDGKEGWGLRFDEQMAGCSGFEYVLEYSEKAAPNDVIFVSHGIEIHVDKAILPRLIGSEIDFVDGLRGSGFKISNPNVRSSCGCASSHGY